MAAVYRGSDCNLDAVWSEAGPMLTYLTSSDYTQPRGTWTFVRGKLGALGGKPDSVMN